MNKPAQIIHEAETQRQFVRLQLPASVLIGEQKFTIKDLSSGGLAIRDVDKAIAKGQTIALTLILPFAGFAIDVDLKADIQYIDKKTNVAGARFVDLTSNQISILNHVIQSYMAGDIVGTKDLLNVVSRENFVNVRQYNDNDALSLSDKIKRYGIYGLVVVATLLLSVFIVNNILEQLFVIKTPYGSVKAQTVKILSPTAGIFQPNLPADNATVSLGQRLATISTQQPGGTFLITKIISPCDCFIIEQSALKNEYKQQNDPLFTLVPKNNQVEITAEVPMEEIHRLNIGTKAILKLVGVKEKYTGTISNITTDTAPFANQQKPMGIVTIKSDMPITHDFINRPAYIEFNL